MQLLTVCTGNICRSPLAELVLAARLSDLEVSVSSAGTRGLPSAAMTREAQSLAAVLGVPAEAAAAHRSRYLTEAHLAAPDLILAMTRDHRRQIAELAPARLRSTFTVREFARLSVTLTDDELKAAAAGADDVGWMRVGAADSACSDVGPDDSARLRAVAATVAARRGLGAPPADPADDDVIDPYGRSWETYQRSAAQLAPALEAVERVVRLAGAS